MEEGKRDTLQRALNWLISDSEGNAGVSEGDPDVAEFFKATL